jgi:hypothetical protein
MLLYQGTTNDKKSEGLLVVAASIKKYQRVFMT